MEKQAAKFLTDESDIERGWNYHKNGHWMSVSEGENFRIMKSARVTHSQKEVLWYTFVSSTSIIQISKIDFS